MGDENTPPIHVLLPTCDETNTDVFYEILKSVVLHTRLHDNVHVNSMISAMTGETFEVDKDDLSVDWKELTSNSRQIRQSKLLGFWAARHYPLIGKKLIGAAWQPPKECNVRVSEPIEITEEGIDNIVSQKMKIRIIEINVCKGDVNKLNYFVRAPMTVGRVNAKVNDRMVSKMRPFDIESEYLAECWTALKLGGFPSNFEQKMDSTAPFKAKPSIVTPHLTIDHHQIVRRTCDQSTAGKRNYSSTLLPDSLSSSSQFSVMSPCNVLLTNISASTTKNNVAIEPKTIPSAKRARCVIPNSSTTAIMHDETSIDTLRVEVCKIREDLHNLTKSLGHNAGENELANGSERFHLAVFKQKDSEISKLSESLQKFEKENELLKDEKTKLNGEIEAKSDLTIALQKVVDANSKLYGKIEEESNAMVQKLSAANQLNSELTDTNRKLREDYSANVESNLQDMLQKSSAADEVNNKLTERNGKLQEDLNVANNHFADMQCQIQDLQHKLSAADQTKIELTDTNGKLQQELNLMTDHVANTESNLQHQIQDLLHQLSAANQTKIELTDTNGKLQQELNLMTDHVANTESNLQHQIQDLLHQLSAANQTNIEFTDTKGKLEQELDEAKIELKKNDKLKESLHNLKARSDILIDEFRGRVEETEKMNVHLAGKNEKLQEELNILKQNAGEEKNLLLLHNQPKTRIQIERKEIPAHDGYDQAELEEENIQCIGVVCYNYEKKLPEQIDRASIEGHSIEPYGELQSDRDSNKLPPEPVKSGRCGTDELENGVQNRNKIFIWEEEFVSDDPIVQQCRPVLQLQKFGWMKFQTYKSSKFYPAFVYPVDEDGLERAQKVKADGYITNCKSPFWEFHFAWELPHDKKQTSEVSALKKFNKKFGANFE